MNRYRPIYVVLPVAPFWRAKITVIAKLIQPLDMRGFSDFITACKAYRSLVRRLIWFHLTYWDSTSQNWIRKVWKELTVLLVSWWAQRTNHFVLLCCAICADHFWYHTQFPCLTHLCFFSRLVFRVDQAFPEAEANFNLPVLSIARHTPLLLRFDSRSYASINSKLQHPPPPEKPLSIRTFEDWIVQILPPNPSLGQSCAGFDGHSFFRKTSVLH